MRQCHGKITLITFLALSLFGTACGILGQKSPTKRSIALEEEAGCLDQLGDQFKEFFEGTVDENAWVSTWTCVEDTLDKFESIVRPSDPRGFTEADVMGIARTFLLKRKPVTRELVSSGFAVKTSVFGGYAQFLSRAEIQKLRELIAFVRTDTPRLIPMLRNRRLNPTPENLRPLVDAIADHGKRLAEILDPGKNPVLTTEMAVQFMTELAKASTEDANEEKFRDWAQFAIEVKKVLVRGADNGIAGADWKELLTFGSEVGAIAIALGSASSEDAPFQLEMAERGRRALDQVFSKWNGVIPYSRLQELFGKVPSELLPTRAGEFRVGLQCALQRRFGEVPPGSPCMPYLRCTGKDGQRQCVSACPKEGCRPAVSRLLLSKRDDGLDSSAFDTVYDIYRTGMRANLHLEAIYGPGSHQEYTAKEFAALADAYRAKLKTEAERKEVDRLKRIANEYRGLHGEDTAEMRFGGLLNTHSRRNLSLFSWYEPVADTLLKAYASKPGKGSSDDLFYVTKDIEMILLSLSMIHPQKENIHEKRFREANLFTLPGNGDTLMDLKETTNYIGALMSISKLSKRIRDDILADDTPEGKNRPCQPVGTDPWLRLPLYKVQCFRDHFHKNLADYWKQFPGLADDFNRMSHEQREKVLKAYEAAAKLSGMYDETDITSYDVDSWAGIPHYIEALMKKFDNDGGKEDGKLTKYEVDDGVWPTFKTEFKRLTDLKWYLQFLNKPLFMYLVQKGGLPFKCQNSPKTGEIVSFGVWVLGGNHNNYFEFGRERLFKVFEELSKPILPGCPGYQPPTLPKAALDGSRPMEFQQKDELYIQNTIPDELKAQLEEASK